MLEIGGDVGEVEVIGPIAVISPIAIFRI